MLVSVPADTLSFAGASIMGFVCTVNAVITNAVGSEISPTTVRMSRHRATRHRLPVWSKKTGVICIELMKVNAEIAPEHHCVVCADLREI